MIHSLDTNYELAEREMLISLAKPGDILFDVGAYVGWYSIAFARQVPSSRVYAFEPIPSLWRELDRNTRPFPNINISSIGLSYRSDITDFYISEREPGTASMSPLEEDRFGPNEKILCIVDTIDALCETLFPPPNLIKIDVEGAELLVLRGAAHTIATHHPIIQCEMLRKWSKRFNYHPNDIIDFLSPFGYQCHSLRDGQLQPFQRMTSDTIERNFFFLPKESQ